MPNMYNLSDREYIIYTMLTVGYIPNACVLEHMGIEVVDHIIVTPEVKFKFITEGKRLVSVLHKDKRVGEIYYIEENGCIRFITLNKNMKQREGSF